MTSAPAGGGLTLHDRDGRRIATLDRTSVLTWLAVVAPIGVVAERTQAAAPERPWWLVVLLVLLATASAELPDSLFPLVTIAAAGTGWVLAAEQPAGSSVVVALALLVFHVATAHAATGPPGREDDRAVVRGVLVRTAVVAALTLVLAALAAGVTGRVVVPTGLLALALLAIAVTPELVRRRSGRLPSDRSVP